MEKETSDELISLFFNFFMAWSVGQILRLLLNN